MTTKMKCIIFLFLTLILFSCDKKENILNVENSKSENEIYELLNETFAKIEIATKPSIKESYYASKSFREEVKKRIEYVAMNEGPYDILYRENSIAANFLIGLFELFKGKSVKEVKEFYGLNENTLKEAGVAEDISKSDVVSSVEQYILGLGFNEEIVAKLKINLGR